MDTNTQVQNDLIEELGLANLPDDKKEALLMKMMEVVLKRIFVETMEKLNEKDRQTYSDMVEANATPEEVEKFVSEKIPNYSGMVLKIAEKFKEEMKTQA